MRFRIVWSIVAAGSGFACAGSPPAADTRSTPAAYGVDAAGRPAVETERIPVRWTAGQPVGFVSTAAACGTQLYLLAFPPSGVQVVDLERGEWSARIGRVGDGPGEFREPRLLAADCARDRLYVVDGIGGVSVFARTSGRYLATTYETPPNFSPSLIGHPFVSADGGVLHVPGLWPSGGRNAYAAEPNERMYRETQLGWSLPLAGGQNAPMTVSIEEGCFADGGTCASVALDRRTDGGWAMAQGGGTRVAVFTGDGSQTHAFDVRSPRFLRDGAAVTWGAGVEQAVGWGETNSRIAGVYAHDDVIATIHAHNATTDWRPGEIVQFNVFMNLYTATGDGLVSDIRLPDLPVGRDGGSLMVVDYGEAGRRGDADRIDLVRITLDPEAYMP